MGEQCDRSPREVVEAGVNLGVAVGEPDLRCEIAVAVPGLLGADGDRRAAVEGGPEFVHRDRLVG